MKSKYLIFVDKRFIGKGRKELEGLTNGSVSELKELGSDNFMVVETDTDASRFINGAKDTIFIYAIIPLIAALGYKDDINKEIISILESDISRGDSFKIEAINIESRSERSAKTIEVEIGKVMESDGFVVDLRSPKLSVCVIFNQRNVLVGKLDRNLQSFLSIDEFRRFNNEKDKVSRAEFKLREAFEYFGVDTKKIKSAIDVGAAPGGWTKMLANMGVRTTAIDSAALDYKILGDVTVLDDERSLTTADKPKIIQIKKKAGDINIETLKKNGKFDMLLIDANIPPAESANLALSFSEALNPGAYLIFTIKLIDFNIDKHISDVREILSKKFKSIKIKKLPYNRLELTAFAEKG